MLKTLFRPLVPLLALGLVPPPAGAADGQVYRTEEIVVTATRTPRTEGEVGGSIAVLDRDDLAGAASPDISTVLDLAPSVFVNSTGVPMGVATASIRGSLSTQVLVLLDGVRLADGQSSFFNLNDLPVPLERVERVEIVPVPASALYGADAMGGVVNIITRPPVEEGRFSFTQGAGSFQELRSAAGAQWGKGGFALRADGIIRSGDGHRENADYDAENFSTALRYAGGPLTLDIAADYLAREGGTPGHVEFPTPEARQEDEKSFFRAAASWQPGGALDLRAAVFYDSQKRDYEDPTFGEDSRHDNRKGGIDLQGNLDAGRWGLWSLGGEWTGDDIESTDSGDHDTGRWAIFLQDEAGWGPWTLIGTARYDEHSVYGSEFNPRVALQRTFTRGWRLWASASRGYRAPNFDDLYWSGGFGEGNPGLQPETSWNYELGTGRRGDGVRFSLAAFWRDVEDLIQWTDRDGDYTYSPENVASARIRGVEAEAELRLLEWLTAPLSYQYVDGEDSDSGEELAGQVRHLARASLRARFGRWTAALEGSYTDRNPTAQGRDLSFGVAAATVVWNGSLGAFPLKASARVDNLLDEDYEKVDGFPMPGRNVYAELGLSF